MDGLKIDLELWCNTAVCKIKAWHLKGYCDVRSWTEIGEREQILVKEMWSYPFKLCTILLFMPFCCFGDSVEFNIKMVLMALSRHFWD